MKYVEARVTFAEVPDEISLCISISGCKIHCPGCHSKYLWQDTGKDLTPEELDRLLDENKGITCVCLMGGEESEILDLLYRSRKAWKYRRAWYTGNSETPSLDLLMYLDYLKLGPYVESAGPLTSRTTNQVFYRVGHLHTPEAGGPAATLEDITSRFWTELD